MTRVQAFNESTLARHFSKSDFYEDPYLSDNDYRKKIIENAVNASNELLPNGINYNRFFIGPKKSFSICDLHQKLILRTCASHLKRSVFEVNKSRSQIAREMRSFLVDGTAYNIYRLDIKSFFENIEREKLERQLYAIKDISMHTKKLASRIMDYFEIIEGLCVPRGLETSSILSNLYLKDFDQKITSRHDVFFYSRFVDDILIISSDEQQTHCFKQDVIHYLPNGLSLNPEKSTVTSVGKRSKSGNTQVGKTVAHFDYLGFRFKVIDSPLTNPQEENPTEENKSFKKTKYRKLEIDLSPRKVKRIKEKICKAFYSYGKTKDYSLLRDRIRFLSTNREFIKKNNSTVIPVGIYYNSSACDLPSEQLRHIDQFMRYLLFGKTGRLPKIYRHKLTLEQKKELAKFSFLYGFENRVHKRFSFDRLSAIVRVWK